MRFPAALAATLLVSGCAMNSGIDLSGRPGQYQSVDDALKAIKKGATTKDQLVTALGTPVQDQEYGSGMEVLTFGEETPFWKAGGASALFMGREQVKVLVVTLQNGVVADYVVNTRWVAR